MKNKVLSLVLCIICITALFTSCGKPKETELPIASPNENITKPEGKFYEVNKEPVAEGGLVSLGDDYLTIMIEKKEYKFIMSDDVKKAIAFFNKDKDNLRIKRGTMLVLYYEIQDGNYFAKSLEILEAN